MIVVSLKTLNEYIKKYPEAEQSLLSWYYEAKSSEWGNPHAIKVNYKANVIYIKWFGTHVEYDKVDFNRI